MNNILQKKFLYNSPLKSLSFFKNAEFGNLIKNKGYTFQAKFAASLLGLAYLSNSFLNIITSNMFP
jgi:hypothetical protein